ncbi:ThiF family adenylyltransferase [Croceitalea marina]|uniref:ThiF family adenylyltransferase n=1 Tax=Croceitalea marina TaxID=1775166 RepID=A0ABW5MTA8_9FLAO
MIKPDRFVRQTSLSGFGLEKQAKLADSKVLIVGLGGLGLPVGQYLNAMGVGTLGLVDQDFVELHNLQRQVLYSEDDIGKLKLEVTSQKLKAQNSQTLLKCFDTYLTKDNALEIVKEFDVIVDATDNFAARYVINDACVILNKPFVYGALHAFEGQVSVFNYEDGPTYRCLFPKMPSPEETPNCATNGILGILPGIIGTLQALETVKIITGVGEVLSGKLLVYDGLLQNTRKVSFTVVPENKVITKLQTDYGFDLCESSPSISAKDFLALQQRKKLQVIDVRSIEEFNKDHLSGSVNITFEELKSSLQKINFDKDVYLLCQSGKRSERAYAILISLKPEAIVYSVSGGLNQMASVCP